MRDMSAIKFHLLVIIFAVVTLGLLFPTDADAGKRHYTIKGAVQDQFGKPISGVKVQACGNTTNSRTAFWKCWPDATAFTDEKGNYTITTTKSKKKRRIRVRAKLENGRIAVREYLLDTAANWNPIAETKDKVSSSEIIFPPSMYGASSSPTCHTDACRNGLTKGNNITRSDIFYNMNKAYDIVKGFGSPLWFKPDKKIVIFYPVPGNRASWTTITNTINLVKGTSLFGTWLHELGHIWFYQHDHGWWKCNLGGTEDVCPAAAFNEGFAEYFQNELLRKMGYDSLDTIGYLLDMGARQNDMPLEKLERYRYGVHYVLHVMTRPALYENNGFEPYECEDPQISFVDVLSVFSPNPDAGWPNALEVGKDKYGLWRFMDRASDILPQFTARYKNLIKAQFNPNIPHDEFMAMLLEGCNEQRAEKGLPPIEDLPSGSDVEPEPDPNQPSGGTPVDEVEGQDEEGGHPSDWTENEQPPEEQSTDDEEELANDHSMIIDEENLPDVDDVSYEDDTAAMVQNVVDQRSEEVDASGAAKGGAFCSLVINALPNANIFLVLIASMATLVVARLRKR